MLVNAIEPDKDYNGDGKMDVNDKYYLYGYDLDDYAKLSTDSQAGILVGDRYKHFMQGLMDSIDEKKVGKEAAEKNLDKLFELWIKKNDKGDYILSDIAKNKIWEKFDSSKKNEYLKKIINKLFNEKYKGAFKDPSKMGIKEVSIDDKDNKLKWQGNKLGTVDKDGKFVSWIDLENPPRWLNKVEFKNNKFTFGFFTGSSNKEVSFNAGTIGQNGEVIGPDGKVIGVKMNNNIKSIRLVNNALEIEYIIKNKEGQEVTNKIILREEDFKQATGTFSDLFKSLKDPITGPIIKDLLDRMNKINADKGKVNVNGVLRDLNGLGFDLFLSGGIENQLNVMYVKSRGKTEKIDLNFGEDGKLKASLSNGASLVTTDSKGNVLVGYTQFFSAGGIVDKSFNSDSSLLEYNKNHPDAKKEDETGEFIFGDDGYIQAAKNGIVQVNGLGKAYTARDEFIGIDIHRNPYIDAVLKGDVKAISEAIAKEGYRALEEILGGEIDFNEIAKDPNKYLDRLKYLKNNLDIKKKLIDILRKNLEDPTIAIDLKRELERALDIGLKNFESSTQNFGDLILANSRTDLTPEENLVRQNAEADLSRLIDMTVRDILSDSNRMQTLISGTPESKQKAVEEVLIKNAQTIFQNYIHNSLTQPIIDIVNANKNKEIDPVLKARIEELTKDAFNRYILKGEDIKDSLKTSILNRDSINLIFKDQPEKARDIINKIADDSFLDKLANSIDAAYKIEWTGGREIVENSINEFLKDINTRPQELGNRIVMDMKNREVYAIGNKYIRFDAQVPLNKFTAYSSSTNKEDSIVLMSNGKYVASFRGKETYQARIVPTANYFSIDTIINYNNPNFQLKLDNLGQGYRLYNPGMTVRTGRTITGSVVGPLFGILQMQFPLGLVNIQGSLESDPGSNPNAALSFQFILGMDKGRIFNRIMNKQLRKKFGESDIPLSALTSAVQPEINKGLAKWFEKKDSYEEYQRFIGIADEAFKFKDDYNVNIPREQELRDAFTIIRTIQRDQRGNYYVPDVQKMFNFLSKQKMYQGSRITITNTYIQVNNNRFTDADPALFRTLVRAGYYAKGYVPRNIPLK